MKRNAIVSSMIAAGIVSAIVAGGIKLYQPVVPDARAATAASLNAAPMTPIAAQALPNFSALVHAYGPAVVNVSVTQAQKKAEIGRAHV